MRDYLYFSERLARKILGDNQALAASGPKVSFGARPLGVGADLTWDHQDQMPHTRHGWAEAVDKVVGDSAVWAWDPNEIAPFVRGRGSAFLGELYNGAPLVESAMVGSTYDWEGAEVNLCLFGSRHNLDGSVPSVDPTRRRGWHSSSTIGVRQLLTLVPQSEEWDEDGAFEHASGVDDDDLVWSAANIMRGQGLVGDANRRHAEAPSLRGHTILEGDFEWLARIYWWRSGISRFHNVAVGAPVYVRTISRPWSVYEPVEQETLASQELAQGRMTPHRSGARDDQAIADRKRPWWWPSNR